MTIDELAKKLKEKSQNYLVVKDNELSFTICYKPSFFEKDDDPIELFHVEYDDDMSKTEWCAESKEVTFLLNLSQINLLAYPLHLLAELDKPIL